MTFCISQTLLYNMIQFLLSICLSIFLSYLFSHRFISHYRIGDLGLVPAATTTPVFHTGNTDSLIQKEVCFLPSYSKNFPIFIYTIFFLHFTIIFFHPCLPFYCLMYKYLVNFLNKFL